MSANPSNRGKLGGLGAVFFLVSLGGIAYYVQRQAVPEQREALRKPATTLPDPEQGEEEAPPPLPWEDRVDLASMALTPFGAKPSGQGAKDATATLDPAEGLYVQELSDGHRLLYTLDPVLQDSALTIFRNREVPYAAAVVLDLKDNSVLAFAGHSTMDPQVDPLEVLTTAWAPAASTFKLVTAASLIENDEAGPSSKECFSGGLSGITDDMLRDVPERDVRCESLASAIAHSHNVVIGKLALKHLDETELSRTAHALGFDSEIPFVFPVEPSPAHFPEDDKERAKVAAGFWHVDMSPVHGALLASVFAREGLYQPPHLVAQVVNPDGTVAPPAIPQQKRVLARDVAASVGDMMLATTQEGTARGSFRDGTGQYFIPDVGVAGKTGSLTGKRAPMLNYNWFVGFAPADKPEIAFAVLIANEPKWRIKAHYAARRLVQIYLERREAIRDHRAARLTAEGLFVPERDPNTGAVVAKAPAAEEAPAPVEPKPEAPKPEADTPLPPVPGPLPQG